MAETKVSPHSPKNLQTTTDDVLRQRPSHSPLYTGQHQAGRSSRSAVIAAVTFAADYRLGWEATEDVDGCSWDCMWCAEWSLHSMEIGHGKGRSVQGLERKWKVSLVYSYSSEGGLIANRFYRLGDEEARAHLLLPFYLGIWLRLCSRLAYTSTFRYLVHRRRVLRGRHPSSDGWIPASKRSKVRTLRMRVGTRGMS